MATPTKTACTECAKAKRKCGRQIPECSRCSTRSLACVYPSRPTFWVAYPSPPTPQPEPLNISSSALTTNSLTNHPIPPPYPQPIHISLPLNLPPFNPPSPLADTPLYHPPPASQLWFLPPSTWTIHHIPPSEMAPLSSMHTSLKQTIAQFQTMVSSWATTGSSPFIHTHLYKAHLPRCVGDAFTSLAAYVMITQSQSPSPKHDSTAEDTVLRIIASKIETIILDEDTNLKEKEIPTFSHIARVHALLVLVAIGLFDGDIRLRHTAERHLATLGRWNGEMLDAARRAAWSGELLLGGAAACFDGERRDGEGMPCGTATKKSGVEALWQAFVLSETVRRTWLVCTGVRGAYRLPQDGQLHRAGGLMFTTAQGIWDAPSAWTWAKLCAEKDVGFMEHAQTKRLFGERRPDEVDTFGKLMLVATWGAERMEIWGGHLNC